MKAYSIPVLEVLSFSEEEHSASAISSWMIGFRYLSEEQKDAKRTELLSILSSQTEDSLAKLPKVLAELIYFLIIFSEEQESSIVQAEKVYTLIEYEEYLYPLLSKALFFLEKRSEEASLEAYYAALDNNLLDFLEYSVQESKAVPELVAKSEVFSAMLKGEEVALDQEDCNEYSEEYLESNDSRPTSSEKVFQKLTSSEEAPWEYSLIQNKQFPVFKDNLQALEMQRTFFNMSSEFSMPEALIIKCWELYRRKQDFVAFLRHTTLCQSKLRSLHENQQTKT